MRPRRFQKRTLRCVRPSPSRSGSAPARRRPSTVRHDWRRAGSRAPGSPTRRRAQADICRERCAAYGRQPSAIALRRDIYVGESSAEARALLQHALSQGYRGIPAEALIAGSIDEVAGQFRNLAEIGYTDVLVRHLTNDQPKVLGSLQRLAAVRAALT
jgi:alkanesulfonate monooxygenase SsuD/methylene tetrahydromethanopterin reductase-like flavin-dependent oxidoreductase (luciferase family)